MKGFPPPLSRSAARCIARDAPAPSLRATGVKGTWDAIRIAVKLMGAAIAAVRAVRGTAG